MVMDVSVFIAVGERNKFLLLPRIGKHFLYAVKPVESGLNREFKVCFGNGIQTRSIIITDSPENLGKLFLSYRR